MASGITITPGFKNMSREDLDTVAEKDFGLDPKDYKNIDEITAALTEAYEAETGAGADLVDEQQEQAEANAEIEALKAQLEEMKAMLASANAPGNAAVSPASASASKVKVVKATQERPWSSEDRTAAVK